MKRWTQPQACMLRAAMNKAIVNATLLMRHVLESTRHEVEADLAFFGKMKAEAENALKAGVGVWRRA